MAKSKTHSSCVLIHLVASLFLRCLSHSTSRGHGWQEQTKCWSWRLSKKCSNLCRNTEPIIVRVKTMCIHQPQKSAGRETMSTKKWRSLDVYIYIYIYIFICTYLFSYVLGNPDSTITMPPWSRLSPWPDKNIYRDTPIKI